MKYIDIHGHLNFAAFDADREEAYKRAHEADVGMITVGTDLETSASGVALAESHEGMWATVGIHPTDSPLEENPVNKLEELARHPKVVAIGECGLDYFHAKPAEFPAQKKIFEEHIILANKVGKPLMLHVRNGAKGLNAYQEAIDILKKHAKVRANFHFFAGTLQDLKDIIEMGNTVSFTGVITFTPDYDGLVKYVPLDRVMSETDCPFVAPAPYRGKRNEPAYVTEVVKAIARIKGEEIDSVAEQIMENAKDFFGIKSDPS